MKKIDISEAGANLGELVNSFPGARLSKLCGAVNRSPQLVPVERERKPIDLAMLRGVTAKMPFQEQSAGDFIREMRDSDRY